MEAYLFKKELYYILNRNLGEINLVQRRSLESKILKFPSQKETGRKAILGLGDRENINHEKDKIITTITSQTMASLIQGGFYKIKNTKGNVIILDGMHSNLVY
jgi:hypothetical protein